ncbi:hypothetical protein K503DRAFT_803611 [Rhizopogon vinicolor AM-OR11-026]|uniref:Chromatin assembly factor 1 subunit A dimerization domain-containing protein n=1 Tax=Rhizopogon vinicolor AM-OR11-026 TaxID=1314800 RepID=A0A1B7MP87_9AGAM|nr:hypothetical protein K503DRAFT_803611 [Rhizopogon vinicolor AM-OR11-026]
MGGPRCLSGLVTGSAKEKAETRIAERIQVKADLRKVFESTNKLPPRDANKPGPSSNATAGLTDGAERKDLPSLRDPGVRIDEPENVDNATPKGRQRKSADPEKAAKKEEKSPQGREGEKQKETQDQSWSIMVNFFGKVKDPPHQSSSKVGNPACGTSSSESEFQKTFKPFILKKRAEIAPVSWFLKSRQRPSGKQRSGFSHADAIVIDAGQTEAAGVFVDITSAFNFAEANALKRLEDIVRSLRSLRLTQPRDRSKSSFKCFSARNARDIFAQLNDAEIAGDTSQARRLLNILRGQNILPVNVLIFHEDARPGYYGSWTRNLRIAGPRSPVARDLLARDYGYDSGEEWEDEGPGDADNVNDAEDDEVEGDEADSDADSWLVDDDEVEESVPDDRDLSPSLLDIPLPSHKRKATSPSLPDISYSASKCNAEPTDKQPEKKRKVVVALDPFKPYRIQLFNDTPYPIDPFTFVSVAVEEGQQANSQPKFAVPNRLSGNSVAESSAAVAQTPGNKRTATAPAPRTTFPDAHVPLLLDKITSLTTANLTFIVEGSKLQPTCCLLPFVFPTHHSLPFVVSQFLAAYIIPY